MVLASHVPAVAIDEVIAAVVIVVTAHALDLILKEGRQLDHNARVLVQGHIKAEVCGQVYGAASDDHIDVLQFDGELRKAAVQLEENIRRHPELIYQCVLRRLGST